MSTLPTLESMLDEHNSLFKDKLGCIKGMAAQIHVVPRSLPQFYKAKIVPHALQGRVKQELEWLHEEEPVEFAEWAAPIEWLYRANLWWLRSHCQQGSQGGHLSTSENWGSFCISSWRKALLQARSCPCLPAGTIVRGIKEVCGH